MHPVPEFFRAAMARFRTSTSDQLTAPYLRVAVWALIGLWWAPWLVFSGLMALPALALAAPDMAAAMASPLDVSLLLVGLALLLSSGSAGTALLIRIDRELSDAPARSLPRMLVFCLAHMFGGWLAGTLAFLIGQSSKLDVWAGLILVVVASFMGAKFIELIAERMFPSNPSPPAGGAA